MKVETEMEVLTDLVQVLMNEIKVLNKNKPKEIREWIHDVVLTAKGVVAHAENLEFKVIYRDLDEARS